MASVTGERETNPALHVFADALVDDLLNLSDAEVLAEADEDGLDPEVQAAELRARITEAVLQSGKARLLAAKTSLKQLQAQSTNTSPVRVQDRSRVFARFAGDDAQLGTRLTMAARNGEGASDRELESILRDLRDLGAIDDEGNPV